MPDSLTKVNQKHVLVTPATCRCKRYIDYPCPVCDGGLAVCSLCGAAEIELDRPCVPKQPHKGNSLPAPENAVERDSAQSSPIPAGSAAPETITISLPALRSVILAVIDDGCTCNSSEKHPWELDDTTAEELDVTNQQRLRFADAVCDHLRQLPARG